MPILETTEISVRFGGHMAVDNVSLSVEEGAITGLIGPNGAGKTTTFNVITGLQPPTRGRVSVGGQDITKLSAHKRARLGVARTFQRLELFGSLSVLDNVLTAAELNRVEGQDPEAASRALLERVGLGDLVAQRADSLSTGNARLVELARAMACRPRVLLLDEPASGLDEEETNRFAEILTELAAEGLGILLVEHDVPLVMRLCQQITVLNFGSVLAVGTPKEIQTNEAVVEAYLGQGTDVGAPA
ncbi:ABC transporter ATP-binding protein [Aquihabitans sp. G128]|uniref:ABC transporter ATP-binding protein n=1 Tax=Aquihabitans sp. G128 TaxID=2849779 RepID=UPI001C2479DB|nr:ABC transporter ATP-binding protein [Aquihabitans sp. G128]QXC62929.1 ABC transporter ATP-binding protein [Aquihabitans sp. G128]